MNPGLLYAALAFTIWGLYPLYLLQVSSVPPLELVLHRSAWSLLLLAALLTGLKRWAWLGLLCQQPRQLGLFATSALLLAANWLIYIYAVAAGQLLEASLGFFINPLVSVLLGVLVLRERLRQVQWVSVALAAAGVAWLTLNTGRLPWVALALACTFAVYGLIRKTAQLGTLEGLTLETMLLAPVVLPALAWWSMTGAGAMGRGDAALTGWLLFSAPLSVLPLLLFGAAARRLPLTTVGLVQYLSPTLQFMLGVWVFHEPLGTTRLLGFGFIWAGLALYSVDALRRSTAPPAAVS